MTAKRETFYLYHYPIEGKPKFKEWEKKAKALLKQLIDIWENSADATHLFSKRGLITALTDIITEYLLDKNPKWSESLMKYYIAHRSAVWEERHGGEITFRSLTKEAEWLVEVVALETWELDLTENCYIKYILRVAQVIENMITGKEPPSIDLLVAAKEVFGLDHSELE